MTSYEQGRGFLSVRVEMIQVLSNKTALAYGGRGGPQWSECEFSLQFLIIDERKLCRINPYLSEPYKSDNF